MNSLRSALTAVLAGPPDPKMQAKGDLEARPCASSYTHYRTGTNYRSGHFHFRPPCGQRLPRAEASLKEAEVKYKDREQKLKEDAMVMETPFGQNIHAARA